MEFTGMRLLVLEDEYLIGLDIERIANECGAQSVHLIATIAELRAWNHSQMECDLAILEMEAHGISSLEEASILQKRGVAIVFTTAYEPNDVPGFPGVPVVGKPYGKMQIVQAAASALDRPPHAPSAELV